MLHIFFCLITKKNCNDNLKKRIGEVLFYVQFYFFVQKSIYNFHGKKRRIHSPKSPAISNKKIKELGAAHIYFFLAELNKLPNQHVKRWF